MLPDAWRITYRDQPWFSFGSLRSGYVFTTAPDLGVLEPETDDYTLPASDGRIFTEDLHGGRTITFTLDVQGDGPTLADREADVRRRVAALARVWRADSIRRTVGATATLETDTGRRVEGRPRRWAADDRFIRQGLVTVTADFAATDATFVSATRYSETVTIAPAAVGGLVAPLRAPLATTADSTRRTGFTVLGEAAAWPYVTVQGPIVNPVVEVVGLFRWEFRTTLADDQQLIINTQPGARSIRRTGGASLAGSLTPSSTPLSRSMLPPGDYELVLRGSSATGSATLTAAWRSAYLTP